MLIFKATILKFGENGEKTGWTYILVPKELSEVLLPGRKRSYRVKGFLDHLPIKSMALIPIGEGDFILPLKKDILKILGKRMGYPIEVKLEVDPDPLSLSEDLLVCLELEPEAEKAFYSLPKSHQNYYSNWVRSCKTEETKTRRISMVISALSRGLSFSEMLRENKKE